jgi:hypothetical protein
MGIAANAETEKRAARRAAVRRAMDGFLVREGGIMR